MTTNLKHIISLVIMTMALAVAASAQFPSLADVGHDKYISEEDGFEIAVPHQCVKVTTADGNRDYRCDLKEGLVRIMINNNQPLVKTDADIATFLAGFKQGISEEPGIKLFGETSAQIGSYRGGAFQLTMDGDKTLMVALAWTKFTVIVIGRANSKVANSADMIADAVESFTFVAPKTK